MGDIVPTAPTVTIRSSYRMYALVTTEVIAIEVALRDEVVLVPDSKEFLLEFGQAT